jgi:hypothetical protein
MSRTDGLSSGMNFFSLLQTSQAVIGAHQVFSSVGTGDSFPGGNQLVHEADNFIQFSI